HAGGPPVASCWWDWNAIDFHLTPPDSQPYKLTLYILDYDRAGRSMDIKVIESLAAQDGQGVSITETAGGVYVTWTVVGPVEIKVSNVSGDNAVVSGIFVD
ncbi:MAG TPA: hypothetical protein VGE41_01160, partial [Verrucomicrobiae bacterium]